MAREERHHQQRRRTPSFSSTLLDAIYHSIDDSQQEQSSAHLYGRKHNALEVDEEFACLRRAMKVEKWMGSSSSSGRSTTRSRHMNSDSSSSTDSSLFSSSETEFSSKSTPKSSLFLHVPTKAGPHHQAFPPEATTPKHDGRFTRTKSRALKIYGDLKKVKQPISPGGKIANFLNSIFTSRNLKKHEGVVVEDWTTSVKKSRSVKDPSPTTCLNRAILPSSSSSRSKSKRSVRFCPMSVIVDEDCQPCGHKSIYHEDDDPSLTPMPKISSHFLKKNMDSFRGASSHEEKKKPNKYGLRGGFYENESDDDDGDSCTSSDLFELESIGIVGINGCHGAHREELPVYGTTNLKVNQAIAKGLVV